MYIGSMAKKRIKRPRDSIALAHLIGQIATGEVKDEVEDGKHSAAVELGRLGGKKGGKARASKLSKEQRKAIAKKAADARWNKDTK